MKDKEIADYVGSDVFEQVRATLAAAFPDDEIEDEDVADQIREVWGSWDDLDDEEYLDVEKARVAGVSLIPDPPPGFSELVEVLRGAEWDEDARYLVVEAGGANDPALHYYLTDAVHSRQLPKNAIKKKTRDANRSQADPWTPEISSPPLQRDMLKFQEFRGRVPMAHVVLPLSAGTSSTSVQTQIGEVDFERAMLSSVESVNAYAAKPTRQRGPYAHVEYITPPRTSNRRFSALSIYLLWTHAPGSDSTAPDAFIMEAGTAMGQAKRLFFVDGLDETVGNQRCGYQPTAMACPDFFYDGGIETDGRRLTSFWIAARRKPGDKWHMKVTAAVHDRTDAPLFRHPKWLRREAMGRMALIAKRIRKRGGVTVFFRPKGRKEQWRIEPKMRARRKNKFLKCPR